MPAKEWFAPEQVEWLKVSERVLGEKGHFGEVRLGRLKFKGRKPFSVAVKQFHPRHAFLFDWKKYEGAISSLRQAGVRMPKMALVEHGGRKVLVSELFASRGGSKIPDLRSVPEESKAAVLDTVAKIINAGYEPAPDAIGLVKTRKGFEPIVYDLDYPALEEKQSIVPSAQDWLRRMYPAYKEGRVKALETLLAKVNHPVWRSELEKIRGKIGFRNE